MDEPGKSRRAIDFHTVDALARFDEKLKSLGSDVDSLKTEVKGEFGQPGLAEQVRRILWVGAGVVVVLSWFPWIYDHFIAKTINKPVFGEQVREKWIKESTKRVRMWNDKKKEWEIFYAIEETHEPKDD